MKKLELKKIIEEEYKKIITESFKDLVNRMIDYEIKTAKEENFPDLKSRLKKLENLRKTSDPKKFKAMYMRITGATEWDLPDELLSYLG